MIERFGNVEKSFNLTEIILNARRVQLLSNPLGNAARDLGVVSVGDTPTEARHKIESVFAMMICNAQRGATLELCATFERSFMDSVSAPIGEVRRLVSDGYKLSLFSAMRERLIREPKSFGSLEAQFSMLEGLVPPETMESLNAVRAIRNVIAHGSSISGRKPIDVAFIARTLRQALAHLGIK